MTTYLTQVDLLKSDMILLYVNKITRTFDGARFLFLIMKDCYKMIFCNYEADKHNPFGSPTLSVKPGLS